MLLVKLIVLLLLGFVIISLFSGLYFLVKDKGQTNRTVNALSLRIGLSIVAIVVIMVAGATGVIKLNPSPLSSQNTRPSSTTPDENPERMGGGRRPIVEGS
ncbi:MAG: twin transmembrane helix small protein [Granulosicoccus sp.]